MVQIYTQNTSFLSPRKFLHTTPSSSKNEEEVQGEEDYKMDWVPLKCQHYSKCVYTHTLILILIATIGGSFLIIPIFYMSRPGWNLSCNMDQENKPVFHMPFNTSTMSLIA